MSTAENSKKKYVTPNGKSVGISQLISLYKEYAKIPIPGKAFLSKKSQENPLVRSLSVYYNSRDVDQSEITTLAKVYRMQLNEKGDVANVERTSASFDVSSVSMTVVSQDGQKTALLKSKAKESKEKQSIHILVNSWKEKSIDIDDFTDTHGAVLTKYPFNTMSWSPDGTHLAYIAEHREPKSDSFTSFVRKESRKKKEDESPEKKGQEKPIPGQEYKWQEDWGEALDLIVHPVLCVLNIQTESVVVADVPDYSLFSPVWIDNETLAVVGVSEKKRKLGLTFCLTRKCTIFKWKVGSAAPPSTLYENTDVADGSYIFSLRTNWSRDKIVFLEREALGPHFGTSDLVMIDINGGSRSVLADRNLSKSSDTRLQGLYCLDLPEVSFTRDDRHIIVPIISFNHVRLISVNVDSGNIFFLNHSDSTLLDFDGEYLVTSTSDSTHRPIVKVAKIFSEKSVNLEPEVVVEECIGSTEVIPFEEDSFHAFLFSPKGTEKKPLPCIVVIHGGPHSAFVESFKSTVALNIRLGFKVVLINFRGGLGVNDIALESLLGKIGSQDVQDCITCIEYFIKRGDIDANNIVIEGGSHGGFLVTHLSGQYASCNWLACTTRNPVTDVAGMLETTDIPDWCWLEALGYKYSYDRLPTQEELTVLYEKSPVKWMQQVKTPTLVLLGSKDRRVPMSQGLKWHRSLKALGVKTACHVYPDNHGLDKVEVAADVFVHCILWILQEYNDRNSLSFQRIE